MQRTMDVLVEVHGLATLVMSREDHVPNLSIYSKGHQTECP